MPDMRTYVLVTSAAGLLLTAAALASPPMQNSMGAKFKVISKGATSTIEIRLEPQAGFDTVRVEAASGVGSLTPSCAFSAVVPGGSYSCQVHVSAAEGAAALTLNVVAEKTLDPRKPRLVEVRHFTLDVPGAAAPAVSFSAKSATRLTSGGLLVPDKVTPGAILTPPGTAPK
jgi:hypothetical protein